MTGNSSVLAGSAGGGSELDMVSASFFSSAAEIVKPQCLQNFRPGGLGIRQAGHGSRVSVIACVEAVSVFELARSTAPQERQNLLPGLLPAPQLEQAGASSLG
jgi:hypothetical protein